MTKADDIALSEAPYGSELYAQSLRLREAILRKPLGLTLSAEELADDVSRRHFCAVVNGTVVGSVSFKLLGPHTLQLKQMAVAEGQRGDGIGSRLLAFAEAWARRHNYGMIILNARLGAEEFYKRHGYAAEGQPFDENTISHVRMTKRALGRKRMNLEIGDKAPSFTLPADGGGKVSLKELKGKTVVLYFYPKDDTSGCTAEACAFREFAARLLQGEGVHHRHLARLDREPRQVQEEIRPYLPARLRQKRQGLRGLRHLGGEEHIWEEIHGRRAFHLPDQRQGRDPPAFGGR